MKTTTGKVSAAVHLRTARVKAIVAAAGALLCTLGTGAGAPPAQAPDALLHAPEREALRFG